MRLFFLSFLLLATCSFGADKEECRVEATFEYFFYQNGGNPPIDSDVDKAVDDAVQEALDKGEDWIKSAGGAMADFLKGANFWITLSSYVSTNRLAFHAGIICTYRVIHKNAWAELANGSFDLPDGSTPLEIVKL